MSTRRSQARPRPSGPGSAPFAESAFVEQEVSTTGASPWRRSRTSSSECACAQPERRSSSTPACAERTSSVGRWPRWWRPISPAAVFPGCACSSRQGGLGCAQPLAAPPAGALASVALVAGTLARRPHAALAALAATLALNAPFYRLLAAAAERRCSSPGSPCTRSITSQRLPPSPSPWLSTCWRERADDERRTASPRNRGLRADRRARLSAGHRGQRHGRGGRSRRPGSDPLRVARGIVRGEPSLHADARGLTGDDRVEAVIVATPPSEHSRSRDDRGGGAGLAVPGREAARAGPRRARVSSPSSLRLLGSASTAASTRGRSSSTRFPPRAGSSSSSSFATGARRGRHMSSATTPCSISHLISSTSPCCWPAGPSRSSRAASGPSALSSSSSSSEGRATISCATDRAHRERAIVRAGGAEVAASRSGGVLAGALARLRSSEHPLVGSLRRQVDAFASASRGGDAGLLATAADRRRG